MNHALTLQYTLSEKADATPDVDLRRSQWTQLPLTISVRYDSDGVAATRDSTDLVGKGTSNNNKGVWSGTDIELTDRGYGGKLVTNK